MVDAVATCDSGISIKLLLHALEVAQCLSGVQQARQPGTQEAALRSARRRLLAQEGLCHCADQGPHAIRHLLRRTTAHFLSLVTHALRG